MWLKQSYYEEGEKAGKLLAWRNKQIQTNRVINSIKLEDGKNLLDPVEINTAFTNYYENLYKSAYPDSPEKQNEFLEQLQFPNLNEEVKTKLDKHLCIKELSDVLQSMNSGKASGPDGLPIEIYKRFSEKLLLHFLGKWTAFI